MEKLTFKNREGWHKWLLKNSAKEKEVWLIYYKKHTKKPTISYDDAVEEALSFGWIDSTGKSIDDEKYMQRWAPRRRGSVWSEINLQRVKKLIREGRMTKVGMEKAKDVLSGKVKAEPAVISGKIGMPQELERELKKDKKAWDNFDKFSPSTKKLFFWSIESAKLPETRKKRIKKAVIAAKENNKFGYM